MPPDIEHYFVINFGAVGKCSFKYCRVINIRLTMIIVNLTHIGNERRIQYRCVLKKIIAV